MTNIEDFLNQLDSLFHFMLCLSTFAVYCIPRRSPRKLLYSMSRRSHSISPPPPAKRPRIEHLTSEDFKDGVFLAPMVRSGARTSLDYSRSIVVMYVHSANKTLCTQAWCNDGLGPRDGR